MANCFEYDSFTGEVDLFPHLGSFARAVRELCQEGKAARMAREMGQKYEKMFEELRKPLINIDFGMSAFDIFLKGQKKKKDELEYYEEVQDSYSSSDNAYDRMIIAEENEKINQKAKTARLSVAAPVKKKRLVRCNRNAHNQLCMGVIAQTVAVIDSSFWLKKPYKHSFLRFLGKTLRYKSKKTIRNWLRNVDFTLAEQLRTCTPSERKKLLDAARKNVKHDKPSKSCGRREHDKMCCRVIAETLWFYFPKMKISQVCQHDAMRLFGNAFRYTGKDTIRNWIKDLAPSNAPGRPKKTS